MSKYAINDTTLTAIADSIRAKGGTSDPIQVSNFASAIANLPSGGGLNTTIEGGDCSYFFARSSWFADLLQDYHFTFNNPTSISYMFENNPTLVDASNVSFNISNPCSANALFQMNSQLRYLPQGLTYLHGTNLSSVFNGCSRLTSDEVNAWFSIVVDYPTSVLGRANQFYFSNTFNGCYSIRNVNPSLEKICHAARVTIFSSNSVSTAFQYCYTLDEVKNFPVWISNNETSNRFNDTFYHLSRAKDVIFDTDNGVPYTVNWKNQTIELCYLVGYNTNTSPFLNYNAGITADKQVIDAASYQALKNDPDWFTTDIAYARYNHDSAVNTINSLPDTSAYLATAGGTNTIKFKGDAGSATDGGAINTLTEEEIAVATAKGWTVAFI